MCAIITDTPHLHYLPHLEYSFSFDLVWLQTTTTLISLLAIPLHSIVATNASMKHRQLDYSFKQYFYKNCHFSMKLLFSKKPVGIAILLFCCIYSGRKRGNRQTQPLNHPESCGTVPILTTLSRCPSEHSTCRDFIRRRIVRFFSYRSSSPTGDGRTRTHFCLHEQWRFNIFYIAMQAGMCMICLHTKNGLDPSHAERMFSVVASSAHAHIICPDFWSEIPEFTQMWSLFVFLIGWEVWVIQTD